MRESARMLACVINVSEGRNPSTIRRIGDAAGNHCLDVHTDADHNRSVYWLAGPEVEAAARALTAEGVAALAIGEHVGVHPRIGVVDVVPFVPVDAASSMDDAIRARNAFAAWAGEQLALPCFLYGPERTLPDVRKYAFASFTPDAGPTDPHPSAGACAVGARGPLVAYNLWLRDPDLAQAKAIATELRSADVRTLALVCGDEVQVSCNLVNPTIVGPAEVFDAVAARAAVARAELVGLIGQEVLARVPRTRWSELDLDENRTLEARLP